MRSLLVCLLTLNCLRLSAQVDYRLVSAPIFDVELEAVLEMNNTRTLTLRKPSTQGRSKYDSTFLEVTFLPDRQVRFREMVSQFNLNHAVYIQEDSSYHVILLPDSVCCPTKDATIPCDFRLDTGRSKELEKRYGRTISLVERDRLIDSLYKQVSNNPMIVKKQSEEFWGGYFYGQFDRGGYAHKTYFIDETGDTSGVNLRNASCYYMYFPLTEVIVDRQGALIYHAIYQDPRPITQVWTKIDYQGDSSYSWVRSSTTGVDSGIVDFIHLTAWKDVIPRLDNNWKRIISEDSAAYKVLDCRLDRLHQRRRFIVFQTPDGKIIKQSDKLEAQISDLGNLPGYKGLSLIEYRDLDLSYIVDSNNRKLQAFVIRKDALTKKYYCTKYVYNYSEGKLVSLDVYGTKKSFPNKPSINFFEEKYIQYRPITAEYSLFSCEDIDRYLYCSPSPFQFYGEFPDASQKWDSSLFLKLTSQPKAR